MKSPVDYDMLTLSDEKVSQSLIKHLSETNPSEWHLNEGTVADPRSLVFIDPLSMMVNGGLAADNILQKIKDCNPEANRMLLLIDYSVEKDYETNSRNKSLEALYFDIETEFPGVHKMVNPSFVEPSQGPDRKWLFASVDGIIGEVMSDVLSNFTVSPRINGNRLDFKIELGPSLSQYPKELFRYRYFILKDSEVVFKTAPASENTYSYELSDTGSYVVQAYVHCGNFHAFIRSDASFYSTLLFEKEYDKFINETVAYKNDFIIEKRPEEFQDFVVSCSFELNKESKNLIKSLGLEQICGLEQDEVSVYSVSSKTVNGHSLIFSGIIKNGGRLEIGPKELSARNPEIIYDAIGNFSFVDISNKKVNISSDFASYSRIWYWRSGNKILVSNHYALLLRILSLNGVGMDFDYGKTMVPMSIISNYVYTNNFSEKMDAGNICQLDMRKYISISKDGIEFEEKETGRIFSDNRKLSFEEYGDLLRQTEKEMADNIRCVLDGPDRFNFIVSDLTGGLDSRAIYAVLSKMPPAKNRFFISSRGNEDNPDVIACNLVNSGYGFEYDNMTEKRGVSTFSEADRQMRDFNLGTIYSHTVNPYRLESLKCEINGGSGDGFARSEYSRHLFHSSAGYNDDMRSLMRSLNSWASQHRLFGNGDACVDMTSIISKEIERMPGTSCLEKFDKLYLFYRSSYHFNAYLEFISGTLQWMPLQSKTLLRLNHLTHDIFRGIKLETDLISSINPLLINIPFAKNLDNDEALETRMNTMIHHPYLRNLKTPKLDIEYWKKAKETKKYVTDGKRDPILNDVHKEIYSRLMVKMGYLFREYGEHYPKKVRMAVYHYATENKDNRGRVQTMYNIISSILDQLFLLRN